MRGDDFAEFGRVVDLRYEVDFDLASCPAQDAVALCELAVVVVIVAVIVVGGLEGREKPVEQIPSGDLDGVHEGFVAEVHAHHFLIDELVDARDFFFQFGFFLLVLEDELMETLDFEDALVAVFVMALVGAVEAGEFLALRGGVGGQFVRVKCGVVGDVGLDLLKA